MRPAPNIRARFGEGLRPRRNARPKDYAPTVQSVPLPRPPSTRAADARIRWRTPAMSHGTDPAPIQLTQTCRWH